MGPDLGRLLYLLATSARAKTIVEFGTSFGISTIYLASALRDSGGGKLITSELELSKSQRAQAHLAEVGLGDLVEHRVGDALELLARDLETVDFLLLDGAKPLYFRVLKLVEPWLRKGAVIVADNVNTRNEKGHGGIHRLRPRAEERLRVGGHAAGRWDRGFDAGLEIAAVGL